MLGRVPAAPDDAVENNFRFPTIGVASVTCSGRHEDYLSAKFGASALVGSPGCGVRAVLDLWRISFDGFTPGRSS